MTNYSGNNFKHMDSMENHSIDLSHSFDLNGTENDETLRLYLRKAGCSDKIEYLSPEQRKAFIYDIIKSNKMPGHWVPSTMRANALPPLTASAPTMYASANVSPTTSTLSSSSSSNSLKSFSQNSPNMPGAAPTTPPSPSTFVTSLKGSKYEISGPTNFRHLGGDMSRNVIRNAFDLTGDVNDNMLKKYMIERDIKENDIAGMRKRDIVRNIIYSDFSWKPTKKKQQETVEPELKYATISTNNSLTPPPTPTEFYELQPKLTSIPTTPDVDNANISNFSLITARFNEPSLFPNPDEIFGQQAPMSMSKTTTTTTTDAQRLTMMNKAPPPPPSAIRATANYSRNYSRNDSYYATLPRQKEANIATKNESLYATVKQQRKDKALHVNIPLPPSSTIIEPQYSNYKGVVPPPTPPKPISKNSQLFPTIPIAKPISETTPTKSTTAAMANAHNVPMPPPPPMDNSKNIPQLPPPPIFNALGSMPAPPPPPPTSNAFGAPMPPPPPMSNAFGAPVPPPPPPAMPNTGRAQWAPPPASNLHPTDGDPRDALLESIRNGVALKKVNKKAATISGIKPRPERKPQTIDFLSELKMGITMRRIKNPADNPYANEEAQESNA